MREGWEYKKFEKCLIKVPKQIQVKSKDYKSFGRFPIVSQEAEIISGYWNDESIVYKHDRPIIIFGDHTKNIKYIDFDFVVGADGTHILYPIDELKEKFFYYFLKSIKLRNLGYARHYKLLKEQYIPVPPLSEQQEIVDYLDASFAKIDAMKANAEKALEEGKAFFQSALKQMLEPKEGWEEKTLKELTTKIGSGATPKGGSKVYIEEGCSLIRSMNVQYNEFKYKDLAHINEDAAKQLKGVEVQENDVLFNITGASIARCCIVPNDILPARVNQHVSILRLNGELLPSFLSFIMNSPEHQKVLLEIGEAGSTRQALTKADLERHSISYPCLDDQKELLHTLDALKSKVDQLQANYDQIAKECDALKQAILRQVFE